MPRTRSCSRCRALSRGTAVRDASFQLRKGEVLGISGLVGAGRTELLRLIAGVDRPDGGRDPRRRPSLALGSPRAAIAAGLGLLPEERKREGIVARRSVRSNIALASMRRFSRLRLRAPAGARRRERSADARPEPQAARDRAADRAVLRRQPAEGHHRPLDRRRRAHPALRRADPRHRCRRQGRDLRPDRAARRRGALDDRRLLRAARDPARRRPRPRDAGRADRRRPGARQPERGGHRRARRAAIVTLPTSSPVSRS